MFVGILFIYSSGVSSTGIVFSNEYIKQIIWAATGIAFVLLIYYFDYSRLEVISPYIYLIFIVILIITLFFGRVVNGSRSWLGPEGISIQPSEFTKIAFILFYAVFLKNSRKWKIELVQFFLGLGIALIPFVLVLLQPDMGTAMVFIPLFIIMSFIGGTKKRYLLFLALSIVLMVLFTALPIWQEHISEKQFPLIMVLEKSVFIRYSVLSLAFISALSVFGLAVLRKKYFYWILYGTVILLISLLGSVATRLVLKEYQIMRLIVFLNPGIDPQGAGWNIIQSMTAVGSGGILGKGFLQGTQSHYQYLPQQSTDFIFSIVSEEWGFLGSLFVFALFLIVLIRALMIILQSKNQFAVYAGAGIMGMIFFHFIVNIGMAMGIMPITGIPLFFLSYGGSSLWTALIAVGLLMSMNRNIRRF